jgi:hypothetical protein
MKYRIIVHMLGDDEQIPGPVVELDESRFQKIVSQLTKVTSSPDLTYLHVNEDRDTVLIPSRHIKYIKVERS